MNYLGHAFVSLSLRHSPLLLAGNVLGDGVPKNIAETLSAELRDGLVFHQWLDAFTDRHPAVLESRAVLRSRTGRCTSIILDVTFDHFLSNDLHLYDSRSLRQVADVAYSTLAQCADELPERLHQFALFLTQHDRLASYQSLQGVEAALSRIANSHPRIGLQPVVAVQAIEENLESLKANFHRFFPELLTAASQGECSSTPATTL